MNKVVVILNVDTDQVAAAGLSFAINEAFGEEVSVDKVIETPFSSDDNVSITDLYVMEEVEGKFDGEKTSEEMVQIVREVSSSDDLSETVERLIDEVE